MRQARRDARRATQPTVLNPGNMFVVEPVAGRRFMNPFGLRPGACRARR
jgi:hypothetical protein